MLRRLFAPRKHREAVSRSFVRLQLEQLEKREVLDAALVQGLSFLAFNAYQTAHQSQQLQATAQSDLARFQQNAASYSAGTGATLGQVNQDIATLKQDASNIQGLNDAFQRDLQFFLWGLMGNAGSISDSDTGALFLDVYLLQNGRSTMNAAMQTAGQASSVTPPAPPPSPTASSPTPTDPSSPVDPELVTLTLNPLNVNLLGLNVTTSKIQLNISAQQGQGELVGNLLGDVSNLVNLPAVSNVVNNVLDNVVTLLNAGSLSVAGVNTSTGPLVSGPSTTTTTPVLTLHVAPITLNLMGAVVTTSPIDLTLQAESGQGLVLGNVVSDLANLFNPPLPKKLTLTDINNRLDSLLNELNQQIPNVGSVPQPVTLGSGQFLDLIVSPLNVNLLGLVLKTSPIQVSATNQMGSGDLLGNIGTVVLNTIDATTDNLTKFNNDVNAILGKVISVLNASTLTVPASAISSLSPVLQELTSPTLVNSSGSGSTPILNLAIASPDNTTPVNVNLLGLQITTSNIQAQLLAQLGDGQVLGNLLYNVANLLNPNGSASLLPIITELGL